jgi:hypothetical protein
MYTQTGGLIKSLNEIRSIIKAGKILIKVIAVKRVAEEVLQWDVFYNGLFLKATKF